MPETPELPTVPAIVTAAPDVTPLLEQISVGPSRPRFRIGYTKGVELKDDEWTSVPWLSEADGLDTNRFVIQKNGKPEIYVHEELHGYVANHPHVEMNYLMAFDIDVTCANVQDKIQWRMASVQISTGEVLFTFPNFSSVGHSNVAPTPKDLQVLHTWSYPLYGVPLKDITGVPQFRCVAKNKKKTSKINNVVWYFYGQ